MLGLLSGYWLTQALYVAAELGIADRLAEGPRTAEDLAGEAGADEDALYRLLRGLSCSGVFDEVGPRRFALTPLSETLRADRVHSLRPVAMLGGHPLHWQAWGHLLHNVRTGETAFNAAHGTHFFDALGRDEELAATFHQVLGRLEGIDQAIVKVMVKALDLLRCEHIVDVGGGTGAFARRIADACPHASVVLFDRTEVVGTATTPARPTPTQARLKAVAGDFFDGVPAGADAYVLKFVLHDWNDAPARQILQRCREAMGDGGRLLVIETIVPEGATPSFAKTHDVNMLVLTGGRERTRSEYETLLSETGFGMARVVAVGHEVHVLEARPG